jgi:SAM-dependent methyltransferase
MEQFKSPYQSHDHSRQILDLIYGYDSFLDSLSVVADLGCGHGLDTEWWATLETRDDPPEPHNYKVYAVDIDLSNLDPEIRNHRNVEVMEADFTAELFKTPEKVDLLWCHDSFQFVTNPLQTLKTWNNTISDNGMMILSIPQFIHYKYNRLMNISMNGCYYNYNIVNLMYMLAVNGFDCRDAYFYKDMNNFWLYAAVYKSGEPPMDPRSTSWHTLIEKGLVNDSVETSINKYGYVRQEELLTTWLDKDFYRILE